MITQILRALAHHRAVREIEIHRPGPRHRMHVDALMAEASGKQSNFEHDGTVTND